MYRMMELGSLAVAGLLSIAFYSNFDHARPKMDMPKPEYVFNTTRPVEPKQTRVTTGPVYSPPAREIPFEDMIPFADDCYKDRQCAKIAEAAYFEDRGGGINGMKAVANVIVNRANHHRWPDTYAAVVTQKRWVGGRWVCQFSYRCELKDFRMHDRVSRIKAGYVAWRATNGMLRDITNGADHYLNPRKVPKPPRWARVYDKTAVIGEHTFYASNE